MDKSLKYQLILTLSVVLNWQLFMKAQLPEAVNKLSNIDATNNASDTIYLQPIPFRRDDTAAVVHLYVKDTQTHLFPSCYRCHSEDASLNPSFYTNKTILIDLHDFIIPKTCIASNFKGKKCRSFRIAHRLLIQKNRFLNHISAQFGGENLIVIAWQQSGALHPDYLRIDASEKIEYPTIRELDEGTYYEGDDLLILDKNGRIPISFVSSNRREFRQMKKQLRDYLKQLPQDNF